MKEFNLGQAVYYCHCYGESYGSKSYRWGNIRLGFITDKKYIEARNQYIYIVGTINPYDELGAIYKTLGPHLIFGYNEYHNALEKLKELCEEVDE